MNDAQFLIRMDELLRDEFNAAAATSSGRPTAQIVHARTRIKLG